MKNASPPTKSASGRSRASVAKAASISPIELALRIWSCRPSAAAASFAERRHITRVGFGRAVSDKRDHRQRLLLRMRGERYRSRTPDKRDEVAPPHRLPRGSEEAC